ncbi:hypothetical protein ACJMK2_000515, partial [Sinanodonta woodiana]
VHLSYQRIEDPRISINIFLREFVIFKRETDFPHKKSRVITRNGKSMIESGDYLNDLSAWDKKTGSVRLPPYDHAMLFTRHEMYEEAANDSVGGYSPIGGICEMGNRISVIRQRDYFWTISTAAHELGHNLGAVHDGEGEAIACNSSDFFILSDQEIQFSPDKTYSRNPWLFSICSVESFKKTLKHRDCARNAGVVYDPTELMTYMKTMPGQVYTNDRQCEFFRGRGSTYCQAAPEHICSFMRCRNPLTGGCFTMFNIAARGTSCGYNK